jgi:hypothetical protein
MAEPFDVEDFPRPPWRRRLLVLALAVAMAAVVMGSVLAPPGASKTPRPPRPEVPRCTLGQTSDCVGGTATVITVPAAPAAPAAASAAR